MPASGSQEHYLDLFEYAPFPSGRRLQRHQRLFDGLRAQGVSSLDEYLHDHPGFLDTCLRQMTLVHVNRQTLGMLKAASQEQLVAGLAQVFGDGMRPHFAPNCSRLWNGELAWSGEGINYTLEGRAARYPPALAHPAGL